MKWIFLIALKLRLRQRFWGDWFLRWHKKRVKKALSSIDLDTSHIRFVRIK